MPTNLYGPNDNFHPIDSHVPAALLRRFHKAKINKFENVEVWGTGKPKREFMHVSDLAKASIFLLQNYSSVSHINVGTSKEISIFDFANLIKKIVGFEGNIIFDETKPDGTFLKRLDTSKINSMGWFANIELEKGLRTTYEWALKNKVFEKSFCRIWETHSLCCSSEKFLLWSGFIASRRHCLVQKILHSGFVSM